MNICGEKQAFVLEYFSTAFQWPREWMRGLYAHVCRGHRTASQTARRRSSAAAPGTRSSRAGLGSRWWEGKCHCDLPRSLPSAGTVMLQGNCWPSMSVSGPLPHSVSQPRRRPYLEQLGWAGPAGRQAGEESGHDGETSPPGLAGDARRCRGGELRGHRVAVGVAVEWFWIYWAPSLLEGLWVTSGSKVLYPGVGDI